MKKDSAVENWATEVKALRDRVHLTQDEFAVKLGIGGSTLSYWETGKVTPHERTKRRFRAEYARIFPSPALAKAARRYSEEMVAVLHQALDIIIDSAPSPSVEETVDFLTRRAGWYGGPSRSLDRSGIIAEVRASASSPSSAAQVEAGKEAQERVHPGKKKKQSHPSKIA